MISCFLKLYYEDPFVLILSYPMILFIIINVFFLQNNLWWNGWHRDEYQQCAASNTWRANDTRICFRNFSLRYSNELSSLYWSTASLFGKLTLPCFPVKIPNLTNLGRYPRNPVTSSISYSILVSWLFLSSRLATHLHQITCTRWNLFAICGGSCPFFLCLRSSFGKLLLC